MTTYLVYWIDTRTRRGDRSIKWSLPFADLRDAREFAKRKLADGLASLAIVYGFDGSGPARKMCVYPESASKIIDHYHEIAAAVVDGPPSTQRGR